ncbi:hypothetical protein Hypma_013549 [Hypsizygus marmoreus]|uniref:Uncharacterized protein n=1 Tax=Hypsizygus marmoreus TaxID=39966 RepID=A0A369JG78_HYPMA|nr:hypothetical protein Hypma_013549 [Hypsizygus marmoreus]
MPITVPHDHNRDSGASLEALGTQAKTLAYADSMTFQCQIPLPDPMPLCSPLSDYAQGHPGHFLHFAMDIADGKLPLVPPQLLSAHHLA